MIKKIIYISTIFIFGTCMIAFAGNGGELKTVEIKTSAVCGMCKKVIEKRLSLISGVKSCDLDLNTSKVKVVYDEDKVSILKIKKTITKTGYDADDLNRNERVYSKLPECCQASSVHKCE